MTSSSPTPHPLDALVRRRRSIRLSGFDYAHDGAYFVTVCVRNRECLLGQVTGGEMRLSEAGWTVQAVWQELPRHYPHVRLDAWVVMPNHVHGIVVLADAGPGGVDDRDGAASTGVGASALAAEAGLSVGVGAGFKPAPTGDGDGGAARHALPEIVRAFKTFSARRINAVQGTQGASFWQRNYYEHVIRSETALNRIRQYIMDNPARWDEDPENPVLHRARHE